VCGRWAARPRHQPMSRQRRGCEVGDWKEGWWRRVGVRGGTALARLEETGEEREGDGDGGGGCAAARILRRPLVLPRAPRRLWPVVVRRGLLLGPATQSVFFLYSLHNFCLFS
jgi:hypothetical protein